MHTGTQKKVAYMNQMTPFLTWVHRLCNCPVKTIFINTVHQKKWRKRKHNEKLEHVVSWVQTYAKASLTTYTRHQRKKISFIVNDSDLPQNEWILPSPWPHPLIKFGENWFNIFCLILLKKQTNKQTKRHGWAHNLHGRVNKHCQRCMPCQADWPEIRFVQMAITCSHKAD